MLQLAVGKWWRAGHECGKAICERNGDKADEEDDKRLMKHVSGVTRCFRSLSDTSSSIASCAMTSVVNE